MNTISDNDILQQLALINDEDNMIRRDAIESLAGVKDARILYPMIKALQDEDPGIQQAAMDALIVFDDEAAVYNVLPLLFDSRVNVRNIAQEILEKIGGSGVRLIGLHIIDKDENVRKMIADILGKINGHESATFLLEMLKDPNNNIRSSAAEGLGRIGDSSAADSLIELLNDDAWVAFFAAGALGRIGDPKAVTPLLEFIKSADADLQITAIEALGLIGTEESSEGIIECFEYIHADAIKTAIGDLIKITHGNIEQLTDRVGKDRLIKCIIEMIDNNEVLDLNNKKDLVKALSRLHTPDSSAYILKLIAGVEADDQDILEISTEALKISGDEGTLIRTLKDDSVTCVLVSVRVLGLLKSDKSIPYLIEIFEGADREIKMEIISSLADIGGRESLRFLLDMLSFEEGHIRAAAARGLGIISDPETTEVLLNRINQEEYKDVLEAIVNALVHINNKHNMTAIFQGFISNLSSEKPSVREMMLRGLGILGNQNASEHIEGMIKDENWCVRRACLETMSIIKSRGLFDGMIFSLTDDRDEVRMFVGKLAVQHPEEKSIDILISLLSDSNSRIVFKAIEGMVILKATKAIPYLTELSNTGDSKVSAYALEAISRLNDIKKNACI